MSTERQTITFPRVKAIRAYTTVASISGNQGADCHDVSKNHWIDGSMAPIANPMSVYPEYAVSRTSWGINILGTVVAEVEAEDGSYGVGVTVGGEPAAYIIEKHLSRFVEGQDPRNVELIWDQMFKSTLNYGRKGLTIQAISAIDLALWDLLGKIRKEPVYALLGGKTKNRLPVYSTTARPDLDKNLGFVGAKIPCPEAGNEGFEENIKIFRQWREKVGPDFPLMLDCYMAQNVSYSIKLAKELEILGFKWMEEFLPPDNYNGYKEVRKSLRGNSVMLTTGEHEYTRYGFQQLLSAKCVDIIQPDITWVGGITEARRIIAMASAYDIIVIPHGSSIYSYHLQYAFRNCPLAEFIILNPEADKITPYFGGLFPDEPLPVDGFIDLPEKPGFGVALCKNKLTRPYPRSEEESEKQAKVNIQRKPTETARIPF